MIKKNFFFFFFNLVTYKRQCHSGIQSAYTGSWVVQNARAEREAESVHAETVEGVGYKMFLKSLSALKGQ